MGILTATLMQWLQAWSSRSPFLLPSLLTVVSLLILYKFFIYPGYLSPLAQIPNAHPLSPITQLWIQWRRYSDREVHTTYDAFRQKGPVVRLGPNEVAVNVMQGGIKTAYGHGFENLNKTYWHDFFMNYGSRRGSRTRNTMSALGEEHTVLKKRVTAVHSKSFVQNSHHVRAILANLVQKRLLPVLWNSALTDTPIDMLSVDFAYCVDFMAAFVFGLSRSTHFIQEQEQREQWLELYRTSHPSEYMFWLLEHPKLTRWLRKLGIYVVPKWYKEADDRFDIWGLGMIDATEKALQDGLTDERAVAGELPVVYHQLKQAMAREMKLEVGAKFSPSPQQRLELASECLDHIAASRDRLAITLSSVLLDVSRRPDVQARLREELRSIAQPIWYPMSGSTGPLPTPSTLENLPYLRAVLKESLRLRRGTPGPNPRLTNGKTSLGRYDNIPSGVRVISFAWCLHRNENAFPNPEAWMPERWLNLSEEKADEMEKCFWAFSSGSRMCLGRNVAMEIIRYALAAIYTTFETSVVSDEGFGRDGTFVTGCARDKLILRFKPVN